MRRIRPPLAALTVVATALIVASCAQHIPQAIARHGKTTGTAPNFSDPTAVDNQWFPLVPGTQFVFEGIVDDGGGVAHRVVFTVTDLTKVINGVRTIVLWDQDFSDGELVEAELAFFAQDNQGNVWNFGEYPEEFEDGEFLGAPSTWLDGVDGAQRGILVPGDPQVGTPEFVQGSSPNIDFLDVGFVSQTDAGTCVPVGCFDDVVVIDETSPLEPDSGHQLKFYAPGVGNVRIEPVGGEAQETLLLTEIVQLDRRELAHARRDARELDRRAYDVSELYQETPRARRHNDK